MKTRKTTRLLFVPAAAALVAVLALAAPQPSTGQGAEADLDALVHALTLQTAELVNNQAAMDTKVDHISEMVRQARIYSARAGGRKSP